VWLPDEATFALRRQVTRRAHIVRQRTRLKNQVQSMLHRNLVPRCPAADLFGNKGRSWLATQDLPPDEHQAVGALLRQLDFHGQELRWPTPSSAGSRSTAPRSAGASGRSPSRPKRPTASWWSAGN
jgi:hypothetical protein